MQAQQAKVARIGFLGVGPATAWSDQVDAFKAGLRDLGYVEGGNIVIEERWAESTDQLPALAAELVRMNVDILVARPLRRRLSPLGKRQGQFPIVFAQHADPVGVGHVARREGAQSAVMLGYGPNIAELRRRTADYVARIFRGTAPGELPIEGPTYFDFVINLRTARRLGIDLPPGILLRADEVIE